QNLGIGDFERMSFVYDIMELSTAIKPFVFLYLFNRFTAPGFLYIDPDIILLRSLVHVRKALDDGYTMVLTPHMMQPLQDGLEPSDLTIMKSGVYNLGFLGVRAADETRKFIAWWSDRCLRDAVVDVAEHKFTDQRWMDLAPVFVPGSFILRHRGYNLAYWNLLHRPVSEDAGDYRTGEDLIHFVHFSGIVPNDPAVFSKHQSRYVADDIGGLRPLFADFLQRLATNGWEESHKVPYAYGFFSNGRLVHRSMRASFRRHDDTRWSADASPRDEDGSRYDEPEPSLQELGPPYVTRVMYESWYRRADLQRAFGLATAEGREGYLDWFVSHAKEEESFDDISLAAAARSLSYSSGATALIENEVEPSFYPWPPQQMSCHEGPQEELVGWLGEPVPLRVQHGAGIPVPRALALLWESRIDLRRHFPNRTIADIEQYVVWCITSAAEDRTVQPSILEGSLGPFIDANEKPGAREEIPRTRLMRYVRGRYAGYFPEFVRGNPNALLANEVLAVWLCGTALKKYHWPRGFVASLVEWLCRPSTAFCDRRLGLTNAMAAVFNLRSDLQATFDIHTNRGCTEFASWVINYGVFEHDFAPTLIPESFRNFLREPAPGAHGKRLTNFHRLVWIRRKEWHEAFPLDHPANEDAFVDLCASAGSQDSACAFWIPYLFPPAKPIERWKLRTPAICLSGVWTSACGRGEDVRMTASVLANRGVDFIIFDRTSGVFLDHQGNEIAASPEAIEINIVHLNADTAFSDFLAFRRAGMARAYTIGYWAWELAHMPEEWRVSYSFYDEIWASSDFAKRAFESEGLRPVELMPMAVKTPRICTTKSRAYFALPADTFIFFYGFDFRSYMSRKNPQAAIAAFRKAFSQGDEKAMLLLKTLGAPERPQDYQQLLALTEADRRIQLRDREYTGDELATLIHLCDCYVSPHRSEGFGRGPAEAMCLGIPVIATGYAGILDFARPDTAHLIDFDLIGIQEGEYPGWRSQVWADPKVDHLAELMRTALHRPSSSRADAGRKLMKQNFSVAAVGPRLTARLSTLRSERISPHDDLAPTVRRPAGESERLIPVAF
ncbi:MAG TPA: glycosyltransferase, partial [Rhizomicrobium sp.]|nr:glycosyltransferase [Rhizomicrobium sp.]